MPTNTTFDPSNTSLFEKAKLNKDAHGICATVTAGAVTNLDFTLTDDMLVTGGVFLCSGGAQGDFVNFQVVHPIAGVLNQFITNWYIDPSTIRQETTKSNYPAKLPAGLILRVSYTSTGTSNVWIAINYDLEKVLV